MRTRLPGSLEVVVYIVLRTMYTADAAGQSGTSNCFRKQPEAPDWPSLTDMDLRASENSPMMFPRSLTSAIRFSGFMVRDDSRTLSL